MTITVGNTDLQTLLDLTQRKQYVNGKAQNQVVACVLRLAGETLSTTSIVRDGKTSVAQFAVHGIGEEEGIPIPDIDRLLGVLKMHGKKVNLQPLDGKIRVWSGKKQTTLAANFNGLAYPHSRDTIGEWETKSLERAAQITAKGYQMMDGKTRVAFDEITIDADILFEALRCDNINGQRLNRYSFERTSDGSLWLTVGDDLKGQTRTQLEHGDLPDGETTEGWESTFEGGLENVMKHYGSEPVKLLFYDFSPEGQGIRLSLHIADNFVFQAGVL